MENISLIYPSDSMELQVNDFKNEFIQNSEQSIPGSYKLDNPKYTYKEWVDILNSNVDQNKVNPKFGVSHTFLAVTNDGRIVGIANLRLTLTEFYQDSGHIGYSVRPTERQKGYATEILKQLLEVARILGLNSVLLTCKTDNVASRKTILKHNGTLTRTFEKNSFDYLEYEIVL